VRFLLASLYSAAAGAPPDGAPEPVTIECPRCGVVYVADLGPFEEPWAFEEQEWAAPEQLAKECSDHRHRFAVE